MIGFDQLIGYLAGRAFCPRVGLQHSLAGEVSPGVSRSKVPFARGRDCNQMIGFDQFIGYLHSSVYGRPALALDLMEEFRPLIVDSVVLTLLNNRMLTKEDFVVELGAYRLKKEPRKVFLTRFEERLNEEIVHPIFGYRKKYRHC